MRVELYGYLGGWRGTSRTISKMRKLVTQGRTDPTVLFAAQRLARKRDPRDYRGQADELFKFVKKHIHYVRDPRDTELIRSPFWVLYYRAGDCDDQAILFSALAEAIGFKTRFKTIKADPRTPDEFSHVYSQVFIPDKGWMSADTIVPNARFGWEADERFGSSVWEGGGNMIGLGQDVDTGAQAFGKIVPWARGLQRGVSSAPGTQAAPRLQIVRRMIGACVAPLKGKYSPEQIREAVLAIAREKGALSGLRGDVDTGAAAFGRLGVDADEEMRSVLFAGLSQDVDTGAEAFGVVDIREGAQAFDGMGATIAPAATVTEQSFGSKVGSALQNALVTGLNLATQIGAQQVQQKYALAQASGKTVAPPKPAVPGWVAPAALGAGVLALAAVVLKRKRAG